MTRTAAELPGAASYRVSIRVQTVYSSALSSTATLNSICSDVPISAASSNTSLAVEARRDKG